MRVGHGDPCLWGGLRYGYRMGRRRPAIGFRLGLRGVPRPGWLNHRPLARNAVGVGGAPAVNGTGRSRSRWRRWRQLVRPGGVVAGVVAGMGDRARPYSPALDPGFT